MEESNERKKKKTKSREKYILKMNQHKKEDRITQKLYYNNMMTE
jgi:hypothetical protein